MKGSQKMQELKERKQKIQITKKSQLFIYFVNSVLTP